MRTRHCCCRRRFRQADAPVPWSCIIRNRELRPCDGVGCRIFLKQPFPLDQDAAQVGADVLHAVDNRYKVFQDIRRELRVRHDVECARRIRRLIEVRPFHDLAFPEYDFYHFRDRPRRPGLRMPAQRVFHDFALFLNMERIRIVKGSKLHGKKVKHGFRRTVDEMVDHGCMVVPKQPFCRFLDRIGQAHHIHVIFHRHRKVITKFPVRKLNHPQHPHIPRSAPAPLPHGRAALL